MWHRFTEQARQVIFAAQGETAQRRQHDVGTEHLLLGLIQVSDCAAWRVLENLGVLLPTVQAELERQIPLGTGTRRVDFQLTPRAKRAIDLSYDEARQLQNDYIGTEHLLLGLIREEEGLAARVLLGLGTDLVRTRKEVSAMQAAEAKQIHEAKVRLRQAGAEWNLPKTEARPHPRPFMHDFNRILWYSTEQSALAGWVQMSPERLLLNIVQQRWATAYHLLEVLDVDLDAVRSSLSGDEVASAEVVATPSWPDARTKQVLAVALSEYAASELDDLCSAFLLFGLLQVDGRAAEILTAAGVTSERLQKGMASFPKPNVEIEL